MTREERDLKRAVVPAGHPMVFPPQCVCCLETAAERRDLHPEMMFTLSEPGVRQVTHTVQVSVPGVPYCPSHLAQLDARLTKIAAVIQAQAETPKWKLALMVFAPALVLVWVGNLLWGPMAALGVAALGVLAGASIIDRQERRRADGFVGGPTKPSSVADGAGYKFHASGAGGTLGFHLYDQEGRLSNPNDLYSAVILGDTVLEFQNADYAALFRSANKLETPRAAKERRKGRD